MPTFTKTNTFVPDTNILSSEVNANFDEIATFLNNEVVQADASVPFANTPSGPSSDPTTADQFARKAYVDARIKAAYYGAAPAIVLAANASAGVNLYSGAGITVTGAGVVLVQGTVQLNLAGTSEQEVYLDGGGFVFLSGVLPRFRVGGPGESKATLSFVGYANVTNGTFRPSLAVYNGNSPTTATIAAVNVVYLKVPTASAGL